MNNPHEYNRLHNLIFHLFFTSFYNQTTMKIKQILLGLSLVFAATYAQAQVKVGSNPGTIGSSSNLEVEATNGQKVIVNKTDGTVTIQNTPNSATNTSILTVDANGLISKQEKSNATLPTVLGVFGAGRDISAGSQFYGTGSYIYIPANSRYLVNINLVLGQIGNTNTPGSALVRATLSDSPADGIGDSPDISGGIFGTIDVSANYATLSGFILVTNSTSAPKAYFLKGQIDSNAPNGGSTYLPVSFAIGSFGSSVFRENKLIGLPVN